MAVRGGHADVVALLLETKRPLPDNATDLVRLVASAFVMPRMMIESLNRTMVSLASRAQAGNTPLHAACSRGSKACAELLLRAGATLDKKNRARPPLRPCPPTPRTARTWTRPLLDNPSSLAGGSSGADWSGGPRKQAGQTPLDVAYGAELLGFLESWLRSTPGVSQSSFMRFLASLVSMSNPSAKPLK